MSVIGILLGIVLYFVVGMVWYSKALFGPAFLKLSKMKAGKPSAKTWSGAFLNAFLITAGLSYVFGVLRIHGFFSGVSMGMTLCIFFTLPALFGQVLWAQGSAKLFFIHAGAMLVSMALIGGALTLI